MPLTPEEELELLELEEEEYQSSLKMAKPEAIAPAIQPQSASTVGLTPEAKAGLAGAAQGLSLGFSDELGAGVDVLSDVVKGQSPMSYMDKWREYQKQREAANKALQEESPWAYGAGEIGGGLVTSLVPVGGMARGATLLPRLARAAGIGATVGAAQGIGASEATIDKPEELAKDAISGATMGLATGGILEGGASAVGGAVKTGKEFVKDSDFLRQLGKAYDYGKKGLNFGSSSTMDKLELVPRQRAKDVVGRIFEVDQQLGQQVGAALDNAQAAGVKINVDPAIQANSEKIFNTLFVQNPTLAEILEPKTAKLLKTIAQKDIGDLSPIEARALKDQLYKLSDDLSGFNSDQANFAKKVGRDLASSIDNQLKSQIPDYKIAAEQFKTFRQLVPESIISKGTPVDYEKVYMGDLKNPELKLYEATEQMLGRAKRPGEASSEERATFEVLRRNLDQLKEKVPEASKKLGPDYYSKLKSQADEIAAIRQATGTDPQEGPKGVISGAVSGLSSTGRGLGMTVANKAGIASRPVSKIYNAPNDALLKAANALKGNKATEIFGNKLEKALQNKDDVAKNAVLFQLMQSPEYRGLIKDFFEEEDTNE